MDASIQFRVECLPWDKAWTLFQEKVGTETLNSHPDVPELAKEVTRECGGLPLALITIGRAMSTKKTPQEWNHAITTLRRATSEFPGMGDPIFPMGKAVFPLLKVSYDNLRNDTIKSCFLYCALFPKGKPVCIKKLVDYWIGEGFISLSDFNHIDEARNYGYDVIRDLKGACLLESGFVEESQVKMHDTIRDMALWITRECGSSKRDKMLTIDGFDCTSEGLWYNAERISMMISWGETEIPTLKSPNLLTLIYAWMGISTFCVPPHNFFEYMPHLRVLDLSRTGMEIFPTSITELFELHYLNLSYTKIQVISEESKKLVKLNYLDLSHMLCLRTIPSGVIGSLSELRVLNLFESRKLDWDLDEVYKLKHLNEFGITISTQHNLNKLLSSSNKNVQMCTRRLILVSKENPQSTSSSSPYKKRKTSPIITLEKLQLIFNLETLFLDSFPEAELMNMGIEQQQHLGSCFQNLGEIEIIDCNGLKDLTWVGHVPNLKSLGVCYCEEIEEIVVGVVVDDLGGSSTRGGGDEIFKRLQTLYMVALPKLKSICRNALAFSCLESLDVYQCPQLKKLPFDSGSNVNNTLRKIQGGPKWWNELQWEEEEDQNNINNNNNNNKELLTSKFLPYFAEDKSYDGE